MKFRNFIGVTAIVGMLASCGTPYRATDTNNITVSTQSRSNFTTQYPAATNVIWTNYDGSTVQLVDWDLAGWTTMDAGDYLVKFNMDNDNYYAWYDSDGTWIGSAVAMKNYTNGLPAAINTTIQNQFQGYTISTVNKEFQKDRTAYEIELKKDNTQVKLLMDSNGNIIKQKMKTM